MSKCTHLSKTDRDACTWAIQQIEPPIVAPEKGFDGFDFSSWPNMPDQTLFAELIKSRKEKHKIIMTQSYIESAAQHMHKLNHGGVAVDRAVQVASSKGWQGFKASWVLNELESDEEQVGDEEITTHNVMSKIKRGNITHISQIPSPVRSELETQMRIGGIKKEAALLALNKIGFGL
jgi:hypothetical protein